MTNPSHTIDRVLDRVRKLLALAEHSNSEAEAALAASRAARLMEDYQLTEAFVRLDDATKPAEPIEREARLEPDAPLTRRKRVAWKEAISAAVATDLGVHEFYHYTRYWSGASLRTTADVRGFGRESAIQTWRYTCEYLWRTVDELADAATWNSSNGTSARAWKNAFRTGCASEIATRIVLNRHAAHEQAQAERAAALATMHGDGDRTSLALSIIERDQAEVDAEYAEKVAGFTRGPAAAIGSVSSHDGYGAGREAGKRVSLGGKRAGLPAGQGRLK